MSTLDDLILDHHRLRTLLDLFERELSLFESDGDADLQLMEDIASHYAEYFNRIHHPLEDRLYTYLTRQGLSEHRDTAQALMEHTELAACTNAVLSHLNAILHGEIVQRPQLVAMGHEFLQANRDHMAQEEQTMFVRARDQLTPDNWREIGTRDITPVVREAGCAWLLGEQLTPHARSYQ